MAAPRVYHYRIDFEGRIFHGSSEIRDPVSIRQLIARVRRDEHGRPYALCMGEHMILEPADVIYVIQSFEDPDGADDPARLPVRCQAGVRRWLDATHLEVSNDTYLYGMLSDGFPARFGRRAGLDFVRNHMVEEGDSFVVRVAGRDLVVYERTR